LAEFARTPAVPSALKPGRYFAASCAHSPAKARGPGRDLEAHGKQGENKDNLGMALFYRTDQASYGGRADAPFRKLDHLEDNNRKNT